MKQRISRLNKTFIKMIALWLSAILIAVIVLPTKFITFESIAFTMGITGICLLGIYIMEWNDLQKQKEIIGYAK